MQPLVSAKSRDYCIPVFLDSCKRVDEIGIEIRENGLSRLQGEEKRSASEERFNVAAKVGREKAEVAVHEPSLASCPLQKWQTLFLLTWRRHKFRIADNSIQVRPRCQRVDLFFSVTFAKE